jgi:hypothetical protein
MFTRVAEVSHPRQQSGFDFRRFERARSR